MPSPRTVSARTVTKRSPAGISRYVGAAWYQVSASVSICPQDGVGGLMPTPRKDRAASTMMLVGKARAAYVMTGAASEGSSSRRAMDHFPRPLSRAAATKSRDFRVSAWARTIFDVPAQLMPPMTRAMRTGRGKVSGTIARSARAMTMIGRATLMSVIRLRIWSVRRLPSAAASPMTRPRAICRTVATRATPSETRAPYTIRANRSRPVPGSTPSQCSPLMPPKEPMGTPPAAESTRSGW